MSEVTDLIMPVLRRLQSDMSDLKAGQEKLTEKVDGLSNRMDAFEGYFTYTMGPTGRNAADIDAIREDIEDMRRTFKPVDVAP